MVIKNIRIEESNIRTSLCAEIQLSSDAIAKWKANSAMIDTQIGQHYRTEYLADDNTFTMWYSVPKAYGWSLCAERCDAFAVACLYFAVMAEEDIVCEVPITEDLFYQINFVLLPALYEKNYGLKKICVKAETAPEIEKKQFYNGTGVSCGVDSFTTILLQMRPEIPQKFQLTHLALFNVGALNYAGYSAEIALSDWRKQTQMEYDDRVRLGQDVADQLKLQFIDIDSNVPDLYQGAFLFSNSPRNCSAVLATQKMWGNYYYASSGWGLYFDMDIRVDSADSDMIWLPSISLPHLRFHANGQEMKRMEKTKYISDDEIVQKNLNVCAFETTNCGRCVKCIRTLLALDLLGKLDEFKESFPEQTYYKQNRWKYMGAVLDKNNNDLFMQDLRAYIAENNIDVGTKAKMYHYLWPVRKVIYSLKNIMRK